MERKRADLKKLAGKEGPEGIVRTTMTYNDEVMLCHFRWTQGAKIPLHHHAAAQIGYVVRGKVRFLQKDGPGFIVSAGESYLFAGMEEHGAEILEDSEVVECFAPARPEYADN